MGTSTKIFAFTSALILGLAGCNSREEKVSPAIQSGATWFAKIQQQVIQPNCIGCHGNIGAANDIDLSSYTTVMNSRSVVPGKPEESGFYTSIATGRMPKGKSRIHQADIDLVHKWISEGAQETEKGPTPSPTPLVSYTSIQKTFFDSRCVVCHNTAKPRGKVDLSSYEALLASPGNKLKPIDLENPEKSGVYSLLVEEKMPPKPKPLSNEETVALRDWILAGAPEVTPGTVLPGPNEPNPPQANYEWLSKNVFSRRCGSCHGIPFKVAGIDFTNYETLLASGGPMTNALVPENPDASGIYTEVIKGHMPPKRKTVTAEEVSAVLMWIQQGAQKN